MIKPILNHLLFSSEFYTLVKRIITAIENSSIDEATKSMLKSRLLQQLIIFDEALNRKKTNPLTEKLEQLDDERDNLFMGLRTSAEALTYHWDETIKEAANYIVEVIRRNGWTMHHSGYTAQSASSNALISELQKEPAATHIATSTLGEWLSNFSKCQNDFENTSVERVKLDTEDKPIVSTTRKMLYGDLKSTLSYLETMAEFNSTSELENLIGNINEIITDVTSSAKARKTRREAKPIAE
ncbi:DUF6261 family protein [Carboxylicivirga sp. M1479]|uniref:DUF6261 family protein n=1 Tax=Carboxylicivirga sp. M1479 TaxID=2594476 RepID=UPI00117774B9|nr:DUF6261 family protein [Carboxylicivirga sp. M1479]TRX72302.1 hypothetical protein FNN09_02700 [Carboxylicivirga sp. M1479]